MLDAPSLIAGGQCRRFPTRMSPAASTGSRQGEKLNDLRVARRQKQRGMQWSAATSASLAVLTMLRLNGAWDLYWRQRVVLPLVA